MMNLRPRQPSALHYRMILLNVNAIASHFEQPANRCRSYSARKLIIVAPFVFAAMISGGMLASC